MSIFDGLDNSKDPTKRDYCSFCIFGDLGKGKSTFLSQLANTYLRINSNQKVQRKVLICDPSESAAFDKYPRITLTELKYGVIDPQKQVARRWEGGGIRVLRGVRWNDPAWFDVLGKYFRNGMVILDESRDYLYEPKLGAEKSYFFTSHRNHCVDVVVVSHNFMDLSLMLRKSFRMYIVFRTGDDIDGVKWFHPRNLPDELYSIWRRLQVMRAPSAKMTPFYIFDRELKRSQLCADVQRLELLVDDPEKPGQMKLVPYQSFKT